MQNFSRKGNHIGNSEIPAECLQFLLTRPVPNDQKPNLLLWLDGFLPVVQQKINTFFAPQPPHKDADHHLFGISEPLPECLFFNRVDLFGIKCLKINRIGDHVHRFIDPLFAEILLTFFRGTGQSLCRFCKQLCILV